MLGNRRLCMFDLPVLTVLFLSYFMYIFKDFLHCSNQPSLLTYQKHALKL